MCTDSYKTFETLNLERYIAQKSSGAPLTESTKAYANSYKTFETLNLERYIAQKSSSAPPTQGTKECINNYKSFKTLNLKRYIAQRSSATSLAVSIGTPDFIKTIKGKGEIRFDKFQIQAAPQRLLPLSLRSSSSNKVMCTPKDQSVSQQVPRSANSALKPPKRAPLPSQSEAF